MSTLTELTSDNINAEVLEADGVSLVFVTTRWSREGRSVEETLEAVAAEVGERLRYGRVDADDEPEIARRLTARTVPTIVLVTGGRAVLQVRGNVPKLALLEQVSKVLSGEIDAPAS